MAPTFFPLILSGSPLNFCNLHVQIANKPESIVTKRLKEEEASLPISFYCFFSSIIFVNEISCKTCLKEEQKYILVQVMI